MQVNEDTKHAEGSAESPLDALQWRPIETAPKNGTRILVWVPTSENVLSVYWDDKFEYHYDDESDTESHSGAWTDDAVESFGMEETASYQPTHWMPLPSPPDASTERETEKEIVRQEYLCEKCGLESHVNTDEHEDVISVLRKLQINHEKWSPHCQQPLRQLRIIEQGVTTQLSEKGSVQH